MNPVGRYVARHPRAANLGAIAIGIVVWTLLMTASSCEADDVPLSHDAAPLFLAAGADYWSTRYALQRPGLRESNALMQTEGRRVAVKSAVAVGSTAIVRSLRAHGRPRAARAVKYAFIGMQLAAAGWNVRKARGGQK